MRQEYRLYGGGGQGNHARRAKPAVLRALGARSSSMPFAGKTGDFWVHGNMSAARRATPRGRGSHSIMLLVIGAKSWIANGFPNARDHLIKSQGSRTQADRHRSRANRNRRNGGSASRSHVPARTAFPPWRADGHVVRSTRSTTRSFGAHDRFRRSEEALLNIPVEEWAAAAAISIADLEVALRCS